MIPDAVARRNVELVGADGGAAPLRVFLDDDFEHRRPSGGDWVRVDRAADAIDLLITGRVAELSLDHDLGDAVDAGNGEDVVRFLEEQSIAHGRDLWPTETLAVHSANSVAARRMEQGIDRNAPMRRMPGRRRWVR